MAFDDLWWPDLWTDLKNDRSNFFMMFDAVSNAAYRVSPRDSGAGLEGWGFSPPPHQVVENLEAQQGAVKKQI